MWWFRALTRSAGVGVGLAVGLASVSAQPVTWQRPDGELLELDAVLEDGRGARVAVRPHTAGGALPEPGWVELPGAVAGEPVLLRARGEHLVATTQPLDPFACVPTATPPPTRAWRLAWRGDALVVVATATFGKGAPGPAWARPRALTSYQEALDELADTLRLAGSAPGLERFFGAGQVEVRTRNEGIGASVVEQVAGNSLLARWRATGMPRVLGPRKGAGRRCGAWPAARASRRGHGARVTPAPYQELAGACFNDDLTLRSLDLSGAPASPTAPASPRAAEADPVGAQR